MIHKPEDEMSVVLISYWPLLDYNEMQLLNELVNAPNPDYQALENKLLNAHIDGCLWGRIKDGSVAPILILSDAQKVADNIKLWSEDNPSEWFKMVIYESGDFYALGLYPDLDKSVERYKNNYRMQYGQVPANLSFQVLFAPLMFGSKKSVIYDKVRGLIKDRSTLALMDIKDYDETNPFNVDDSKLIDLGNFDIIKNMDNIKGPMDGFIESLSEPSRKSRINKALTNEDFI